jgi:SAM-dependent methyltransferase
LKITPQLKLLVAIASFGQKNLPFLKQIIRNYQDLPMSVDVVVVSESAKELGSNVKVVVGLPSKNPWSLPFAHKKILAENVEQYDLFIYTEDDMDVSKHNILAFIQNSDALTSDEIAGFIRYETDPAGSKILTDVHGRFHWKPESVKRRGDYTVAEFSNEHAAFYILTQPQLRKAIASGGYLREPYEGEYGLPETAATDPYTSCGFRKVVCISHIDNFLIQHMSNLYINRHGLSLIDFKEQIGTLLKIQGGLHPASMLFQFKSKLNHGRWEKSYYETPEKVLLEAIPDNTETVLSVGCGSGAAEAELKSRGCSVTALPLDSVIGAVAAQRGIEVVYGTLDEGFKKLKGRKFDCVFLTNLLHLHPNPAEIFDLCSQYLASGGSLVVAGPNFNRLPLLLKRILGWDDFGKLRHFDQSGISICGPGTLKKRCKQLGLCVETVEWFNSAASAHQNWAGIRQRLGGLTKRNWIIRACCMHPSVT